MAKGVGIAALALAILAIFIPLYGLFISGIASLCAVLSALAGDRIFATASPVITAANLLFLSPSFWYIQNSSPDKTANYVIIGVLAGAPFIAMFLNHSGALKIGLPPLPFPVPSPNSSPAEPSVVVPPATADWRTTPGVVFYRRKPDRTLFRKVALNTRPNGDFGPVHPDLASIRFARDGKLILTVDSAQPCALRRAGVQRSVTDSEKRMLTALPGDVLLFGDWELSFEEF
jgi:hypothetical protein